MATLYVGSFVNFGHIIVSNNLAREGRQIDNSYICEIGALGARANPANSQVICKRWTKTITPRGWRDWSWRKAPLAPFTQHPLVRAALPRDMMRWRS